jgi:hypothetical protein
VVDQIERIPRIEESELIDSFSKWEIDAPIILSVVDVASGGARDANKTHKGEDNGNDEQLYVLTTAIQ